MVCSGLMLACAEGPETETTTIVLDSMGDEMDQADEVETDESDASSSESGDSDDTSTTDSDDTSTTDSDDTSTSSTSTSSTTSTDTADDSESTTGGFGQCGWDEQNFYYDCGFQGADPGGTPIECPPGLVEDAPCSDTGLTGQGCCDANGNNWYCAEGDFVFLNACG